MKKHTLLLLVVATAIATTALAVDSADVMLRKIFGTDAAMIAPPLMSHAPLSIHSTLYSFETPRLPCSRFR